jgi:hypothetical protein
MIWGFTPSERQIERETHRPKVELGAPIRVRVELAEIDLRETGPALRSRSALLERFWFDADRLELKQFFLMTAAGEGTFATLSLENVWRHAPCAASNSPRSGRIPHDFQSTPNNGLRLHARPSPFGADSVAKVFLQQGTQILRAVGAAIE